jgi:hypothetical protein
MIFNEIARRSRERSPFRANKEYCERRTNFKDPRPRTITRLVVKDLARAALRGLSGVVEEMKVIDRRIGHKIDAIFDR